MATRTWTAGTVLTVLTLMAAGCTAHSAKSAPRAGSVSAAPAALPPASSAASASPSTSPSAAPATPPPSVAALTKAVAHSKLTGVTAHASFADPAGTPALDVCGGVIAAFKQVSAATTWTWAGASSPEFRQTVLAFQSIPGSVVVAQTKALAGRCKSTTLKLGEIDTRITAGGPMAVHAPAGVDGFYAFCETHRITKPALFAGTSTYCTAVFSRDHLVVFLNSGGAPQPANARDTIEHYLGRSAKELIAAAI